MFTFLLPRCEHCDKRLGAEHNAESCARTVASRPSRRFFLMGALGSAAALILPVVHALPLIGRGKFQLTPESIALADTVEAILGSSELANAMREAWPSWKKSRNFAPVAPLPAIEEASIFCPQINGPDVAAWEVRHSAMNGWRQERHAYTGETRTFGILSEESRQAFGI